MRERTTAFMSYVKLNFGVINIVVLMGLLPAELILPRKRRLSDTALNLSLLKFCAALRTAFFKHTFRNKIDTLSC